MGTVRLQAIRILTLEPERLKNRSTTMGERITGDGQGLYPRRSNGLRLQFLDVEVFFPFPDIFRSSVRTRAPVATEFAQARRRAKPVRRG